MRVYTSIYAHIYTYIYIFIRIYVYIYIDILHVTYTQCRWMRDNLVDVTGRYNSGCCVNDAFLGLQSVNNIPLWDSFQQMLTKYVGRGSVH